jgi:protein-disulfide isomerase
MGKREDRRAQRLKEQRRKTMLSIVAILAGLLLVTAALFLPKISYSGKFSEADVVMPVLHARPVSLDNTLGDPNAPVKVMEFSSFTCSHCAEFALDPAPQGNSNALEIPTEEQLINLYINSGKVYFTYIPFGWTEDANRATEAAFCAMDQGKFWEYRDVIFANQTNQKINGITDDSLEIFAKKLSLDQTVFINCLEGGKYHQKMLESNDLGTQLGIEGTPTFFVNRIPIYSTELIQSIENALKG